jgi:hypothetical protein
MLSCKQTSGEETEKLLHQVGDLFELNVKLWCQKVNVKTLIVGLEFDCKMVVSFTMKKDNVYVFYLNLLYLQQFPRNVRKQLHVPD